MKDNLDKKILIKIIELAQFGSKRVIGDILKDKLIEKGEKDKLSKLSEYISNYIFEEDVKERIKDYIEKDIYNNIENIPTLSQYNKSDFIEDFFKQHSDCNMYRKDIEKIFEKYLKKVEDYEKSVLSKSDKIIIKTVHEVGENSRKDHEIIKQVIKETEKSVIKEIREKDKLGMISIEEKEKIQFEIQDVQYYPEEELYNYFGGTIDYSDPDKISSKLIMKIKINNVGTDFLYNIIVKKFHIYTIGDFDNDCYEAIKVCFYEKDNIIKNTILPGTNSHLNFIFDPFNYEGTFNDGIFQDLSEKLDINLSFDIKLKNGEVLTQEFQIYCSRIDGDDTQYLIDSVTNTFNINEK